MRRPISMPTAVSTVLGVLLALGALAACDGDPTGIVGSDNELIAFATHPNSVSPDVAREIFVMRPDGSGVTQLTDGALAKEPAWSPDGSMIAYARLAAGDRNIYVMNADGGDPRALTTGLQARHHPTWSPDGDRVLFVQAGSLYTVDLEGGDPALLHDCTDIGGCQWPAWSPDGSTIAFEGRPGTSPTVHLLRLDGSAPTPLVPELEYTRQPAWSPDGSMLLFTGTTDTGFGPILATAQGEVLRTFEVERLRHLPSFSRDGEQIVYSEEPRDPGGDDPAGAGIYVMDLDGDGAHRIHELPADLDYWVAPVWRP